MCRDFYRDRRDKSRLSRQIEILEIFEGNRDFVEINRDVVETFRTFLDFQNKNLNFPHFLPILKPILKQKSKQINVGN
jgi:hypothetical protein